MEVTIPFSHGFPMFLPAPFPAHLPVMHRGCDWWHSTFLPSASLWGRTKHADSHSVSCLAKTFPKTGKVSSEKGQGEKESFTSGETTRHSFLERWENVPASFSPELFLLSRICISGGSSSISPTPEHRQICWIFLSTSAKNKRYPLVHKFITRCWWCQRLHGSGVGHLEQTLCISSSH